jgi:hypothetical protein
MVPSLGAKVSLDYESFTLAHGVFFRDQHMPQCQVYGGENNLRS